MIDRTISEGLCKIMKCADSNFFEEKKVLVTGGAGFLGSYLCDTLVRLGSNVTCLDNFATGTLANIARAALSRKWLKMVISPILLIRTCNGLL